MSKTVSRLYTTGAVLFCLTGIVHTIGQFAPSTPDAGSAAVEASMKDWVIPGSTFTYWNIMQCWGALHPRAVRAVPRHRRHQDQQRAHVGGGRRRPRRDDSGVQEAWKHATQNQRLMPVGGLTPDQRFFVGYAQWDCSDRTPESARLRAKTDPHSPGRWRINGVVANMPEFGSHPVQGRGREGAGEGLPGVVISS